MWGVGGISAEMFARAGVGHLILVDGGVVAAGEVPGSTFSVAQTGTPRAEAMEEVLKGSGSTTVVSSAGVAEAELSPLLEKANLVVDASPEVTHRSRMCEHVLILLMCL